MKKIMLLALFAGTLCGCVSVNQRALDSGTSQLATRNYQTKSFDTSDSDNVIRNIVSTMQDLGFIIDKADKDLGTVSGFSFNSKTNMTVTVRQKGKQCLVRANAEYNNKAITEPVAYQNFFNALAQSLFLTANDVI